jgi:TetR/AcrR family transcriptional repressor of nem operon
LAPRAAIGAFFDEIIELSLADDQRKGCLIVNSALELAPHDAEFQAALAAVLRDMEAFFYLRCVKAGQDAGAINITLPADDLARMLLSLLMGLRVLARSRPRPELLRGLVRPALALLDGAGTSQRRSRK